MAHWVSQGISTAYANFRPRYPQALFEEVVSMTSSRKKLVDVGCGTGQALQGLAPHFEHAIGVDPSASQIEAAAKIANVKYIVGPAENFSCPPDWEGQVDLITVAQAMHWFQIDDFAAHVTKLLRPGGLLAVWFYPSLFLQPRACHHLWKDFDDMMLKGQYWPSERYHIDNHYVDLVDPLAEHLTPFARRIFAPKETVTVERFINYMSTMSGVNRYKEATGHATVLEELSSKFVSAVLESARSSPGSASAASAGAGAAGVASIEPRGREGQEGESSELSNPEHVQMRATHEFHLMVFQKPME